MIRHFFCNNCMVETKHIQIAGKELSSKIHYEFLTCDNCGEPLLVKFESEYKCDIGADCQWPIEFSPVRMNLEMKSIKYIPGKYKQIYKEIYSSYYNENYIVVAGGIRSMFEMILNDNGKIKSEYNQHKKDDGLEKKVNNSEIIHPNYKNKYVLFKKLGDQALHELKEFSKDQSKDLITCLEDFIHHVYLIEEGLKKIKS